MGIRCFLFHIAMQRAHLAMKLGSLFPVTRLPLCYDATAQDVESAKAKNRYFVTVGRNEYTLWSQEVDHSPAWSSWSTNTATEFIRKYQHRYLHHTITFPDGIKGPPPLYPQIVTAELFMPYGTALLEGRKEEFEEKVAQFHNAMTTLFENHLKSPVHRFLCGLLAISNWVIGFWGQHAP